MLICHSQDMNDFIANLFGVEAKHVRCEILYDVIGPVGVNLIIQVGDKKWSKMFEPSKFMCNLKRS